MLVFLGVLLATIVAYFLKFHYNLIHGFYLSLKMHGPPALPVDFSNHLKTKPLKKYNKHLLSLQVIGNGLIFFTDSSSGILL